MPERAVRPVDVRGRGGTLGGMPRPYVICHMVTSIDGKTLSRRWGPLPGGATSAELFNTTAAGLDAPSWLVGTTTMREFAVARPARLPEPKTPVPPGDHVAAADARTLAVGVDARGVLRFAGPDVDGDHTVILTTAAAPPAYRVHLRAAGVSYLLCGPARVGLARGLAKLHAAFGLRRLCLQGGGTLNGSMLRGGLVDEISHVIAPVVDGGGPSVTGFFDAPGRPARSAAAHLRLVSQEPLPGGAHWFRYRVQPR